MITCSISSCAGSYGFISADTKTERGLRITQIKSFGLQVNNIPDHRGVSLGFRRTSLVTPISEQNEQPNYQTHHTFYVPWNDAAPIHSASYNFGVEFALESGFKAFSIGFASRQVTVLDISKSQSFSRTKQQYKYTNHEKKTTPIQE